MSNALNATIARLAREMQIGNEMIAAGNNNKLDHMAAWEKAEKATPINASIKLTCAEIRDVAKGWTGTRKEFIADMVHNGVNPATAATQWQKGRK